MNACFMQYFELTIRWSFSIIEKYTVLFRGILSSMLCVLLSCFTTVVVFPFIETESVFFKIRWKWYYFKVCNKSTKIWRICPTHFLNTIRYMRCIIIYIVKATSKYFVTSAIFWPQLRNKFRIHYVCMARDVCYVVLLSDICVCFFCFLHLKDLLKAPFLHTQLFGNVTVHLTGLPNNTSTSA